MALIVPYNDIRIASCALDGSSPRYWLRKETVPFAAFCYAVMITFSGDIRMVHGVRLLLP